MPPTARFDRFGAALAPKRPSVLRRALNRGARRSMHRRLRQPGSALNRNAIADIWLRAQLGSAPLHVGSRIVRRTGSRREFEKMRLTNGRFRETIVAMKRTGTMTELLREALKEAGSLYPIAAATGVERASMTKFLKGERSLRLDKADALAAYLGIKCTRSRTRGKR
ncbi:MAG: hypothetical protein AMXMBFR47_08230 [Planctomycetota bacterium]